MHVIGCCFHLINLQRRPFSLADIGKGTGLKGGGEAVAAVAAGRWGDGGGGGKEDGGSRSTLAAFELAERCWQPEPGSRPSFEEVGVALDEVRMDVS